MNPKRPPPPRARTIQAALDDPIRIVPLWVPGELVAPAAGVQAPPPPQLSYRGGALLTSVQLFTLFWGAAWDDAAQQTTLQSLNRFFQFVVASPYLDQLKEYSTPQHAIGAGRFTGSVTVRDPAPGTNVSDSAIQHLVQQQLASDASMPAPTANSLYFVLLPPGVSVSAGGDRSCQAFCGYHDHVATQLYYAVVPYPNCAGCLGNVPALDALTSVCSHELAEAITDPIPGQGWYDDDHGEIGDICAWQNKKVGAYVVQRLWSNRANACV